MKNEKIIIVGKTASGKNYLANYLVQEKGLLRDITYTTRPIRIEDGEEDGVDYNFVSRDKFESMINESKFYEYKTYEIEGDEWYYGSINDNWNSRQVFIKTPAGVEDIKPEDRKDCFVVYLDIDMEVRKNRLLERKDFNDTIERRFRTDEEDFKNFEDYDLRITDTNFDLEMVYELMD